MVVPTYEIAYHPKSDTFELFKNIVGFDWHSAQCLVASASTREELEERLKKMIRETVTRYDQNGNRIP